MWKIHTYYLQFCEVLRLWSCPTTTLDRMESLWQVIGIVICLKELIALPQRHFREQKETNIFPCIGPAVVGTLAGHVSKVDSFSKLTGVKEYQ